MRTAFLFALLATGCDRDLYKTPTKPDTSGETGDPDTGEVDSDGDGVPDDEDPCPDDAEQWLDTDGDGVCDENDDACTGDAEQWTDEDGDGVCDEIDDACPDDPEQWTDEDGDGVCDEVDDACDDDADQWTDTDGDGACDETGDDCPDDENGWVDSDGDGDCDGDDDTDGDGIADSEEEIYGEDCAISSPIEADSDGDGVEDPDDPYPRDPWPEYMLTPNDDGTINLYLSNRDGTFDSPIAIGDAYGVETDTGSTDTAAIDTDYRYQSFAVSDFDGDGKTDFLAVGDADTSDEEMDIWWFWRGGHESGFNQTLLGTHDDSPIKTTADLNNDDLVDTVVLNTEKASSGYVATASLVTYQNTGLIASATCFATTDPTNPDGCAFIEIEAGDLNDWAEGAWGLNTSRDAVDVDGDGFLEIALGTNQKTTGTDGLGYLISHEGQIEEGWPYGLFGA
ncbi:MAG: hypothetical protein QGG40_12175, partial [Myxococcota bacterium]|nr:hypothetical protein [Myxococcota bacterium]